MLYVSTRGKTEMVSSAHAISSGLASDGGLFVPRDFPPVSRAEIDAMSEASYEERAVRVLSRFLTDYSEDELRECVTAAYSKAKFGGFPAPLHALKKDLDILELWHGPTCAFKDMALQILPHFLTRAVNKTGEQKKVVILVATSGDTGKAAMAGFADVAGTEVIVFYPYGGVSTVQQLQMTTQRGENVHAVAVEGNFDDAQTGVKMLFGKKELEQALEEHGCAFSSANSINWGRLVPQIVYYFSAYADAIKAGRIKNGDPVNFSVPTGNFGDILAGYYASLMGLPVNKFICASNTNNVLTDFINTGTYDRNRKFYRTISPSMDILVSSNLERLLFHLSGENDDFVKSCMEGLFEDGHYTVDKSVYEKIRGIFEGGCCDDAATKQTIGDVYKRFSYLCDTHTAVAVEVYYNYARKSGDTTPCVIASTASPYKFSPAVLEAVGSADAVCEDGFVMMERLHEITGEPIPAPLAAIQSKPVRFNQVTERSGMTDVVLHMLGI